MAKIGKQRLPIPENITYCRILIAVNNKKLRPQEIADKVGSDQSVIIRQLGILIKEGYIIKIKEGKTKLYSLNIKKVNQDFVLFLIDKSKTYEEYLKRWSKSSVTAKGLIGQQIIKRIKEDKMPFQQLFKKEIKNRLILNPFLQNWFLDVFQDLDRLKKYDLTFKEIFEYVIQRHIVDKDFIIHNKLIPNYWQKKDKKDPDAILYSCFDPRETLKQELDVHTESYEGFIDSLAKENPKQAKEFKEEIKKLILTKEEWQYLYDYVVLLPFIFEEISKNRELETAFMVADPLIPKLKKKAELIQKVIDIRGENAKPDKRK